MKRNCILAAGMACAFILSASILFAQQEGNRPVRGPLGPGIVKILENAGLPLTPEQLEQLKALQAAPGVPPQLESILTEEQKQALEKSRQEQMDARQEARQELRERMEARKDSLQARADRLREHELDRIAQILQAAGVPLTQEQLDQLKTAERPLPKLDTILTPEQKQALADARQQQQREAFQERLDRVRERIDNQIDNRFDRIAQYLEKTGCSLTADQLSQLKAVELGLGFIENIRNILTDQQELAIRDARIPLMRELQMLRNRLRAHIAPPDSLKATEQYGTGKAAGVEAPGVFTTLRQNYPNPFNPSTTIEYTLARPEHVTLEIFTQNGQRIATLIDSDQAAGVHSVVWDASRNSNGVYIYRIIAGEYQQSMKMLFVK